MELTLNATKPPVLKLSPSGANVTVFGDVLVYVLKPGNSSNTELAFTLGAVSNIINYDNKELDSFFKRLF